MEIPRHWRLKKERYKLEIDLKKTNGVPSFPPRPIPVGGNQAEIQKAIDAHYKKLQRELAEIPKKILEDQRIEEELKKAPKPMWETFNVSVKEKGEVSKFSKSRSYKVYSYKEELQKQL